jgi:ubiquinone/menaquinone biosynthesis C-methylase UbiE
VGTRGIRFQTRMLELIRKYSWTDEKRSKLYRNIDLSPEQVVVDVGCGTGAFTRVIAEGLDYKKGGRVIGVDRNEELLRAARRFSEGDKTISFRKGDASKSIPLPDNFADRVTCQAFLYLFDDKRRENAIKEMIRICKHGGIVAASEGAVDSAIAYADGNARLNELQRKQNEALILGYRKVYGYDRNIGYKLPVSFKKLGLKRIRLDVYPYSDGALLCDDRVPLKHRMDVLDYWELRYPTNFLSNIERCKIENERRLVVRQAEPSLIAGGMSYEEIIEFMQLRKSRAQSLLDNPELLQNDVSVAFGVGFLTTGIKQ